MAGIYVHIPFCSQACYYCDFHFSTSLKTKTRVISAIKKELTIQKDYLESETINTIYFGGGTPSVLKEKAEEWFEGRTDSPFMLITYNAKKEKIKYMPAPIHVDGSARIQTVDKSTNPLYWNLIKQFENQTGVPALINTSFNESEPIVDTPKQAIETFTRTNMDVLVMGNYVIE